jgi:signal transduction histidine kinase/CheY-like chemotaxis protein
MSKFFNNMSVKRKFTLVLAFIILIMTVVLVFIRIVQVENQQRALITERLQGNANMTVGIFRAVRNYTEGILDVVATMPYVQEALTAGVDTVYAGLKDNLTTLFYGMNQNDNGVLVYANIFLFDKDLELVVKARTEGTNVDIQSDVYAENIRAAREGLPYTSPVARNLHTGRMQFLFTQPVMVGGEFVGLAAILSNTEMLSYFLREPTHDYDSFINIADSGGTIFFSNRSIYMGKHIDDLGVREALGYIPYDTVFNHTSAVTGIDKVVYITVEPTLNWTVISFFDADAVDNIAGVIFVTLFPTLSGIILAAVLMLLIVSKSLKPLSSLADSAEQIAGGNLDISFDIRTNDEIAKVSRSFMEIVNALRILRDNFSSAESSMINEDVRYRLEDARLHGVYDEIFASTNKIFKHVQRSQLEAERASKAKSGFLAVMSHEIRTPINAILGIAQIQIQQDNLPSEFMSALQKIYNSGINLLGIINDILDMSKIETGKMELHPVEYDVAGLINDAVQLNIVRIGSKHLEFVLDIDENLPSRLIGDELRLKQILNNLLSNGIKYTREGHVRLSVNHTEIDDNVVLQFIIEDTGQGMKPEDLQKLFSEYSRFNSEANRKTEGTGLGLNITRNLIEMMGGAIRADSEYGKGTTFTVEVFQKAVKCEPIGAELVEKLCSFSFIGGRQTEDIRISRSPMPYGRVLIVDDVETNLYVAEGLLALYGLQIETVISGFAAIDKIKSGVKYDIVFMDHMMPQMDGIETTQILRKSGYKGIIVALTANALVGNDEIFIQKGFDGFIPKPIDVRQLNKILNTFIRDRYPDEAAKYKSQEVVQTHEANSKVLQVFCSDAEKAIAALRESRGNNDKKLFITTAHAMKAALANIGEAEASKRAAELEAAGLSGNADDFIKTLEALITKHTPDEAESADIEEDTAFLNEQLNIVKTACESFDDDTAYAALDRLKQKQWNKSTAGRIELIRDALYIYSDFEKAIELAAQL